VPLPREARLPLATVAWNTAAVATSTILVLT
jgi:hypothetical protein